MTFLSRMYSPVRSISKLSGTIHGAVASAERIVELLDEKPSDMGTSLDHPPASPGAIAFDRA